MSSSISFLGAFTVEGLPEGCSEREAVSYASKETKIPKDKLHASKSEGCEFTFRVVENKKEFSEKYKKTIEALSSMVDQDLATIILSNIGISQDTSKYDIKTIMDAVKSGPEYMLSMFGAENIEKIHKNL